MEYIEGLAQILVILVISPGARKAILQRLCNAIKSKHDERSMNVQEFLTKSLFAFTELLYSLYFSNTTYASLISGRRSA